MKGVAGALLLGFFAGKTYLAASAIGPKLTLNAEDAEKLLSPTPKMEWLEICGKLIMQNRSEVRYGNHDDLRDFVVPIVPADDSKSSLLTLAIRFHERDFDSLPKVLPTCFSGLTDPESTNPRVLIFGQDPELQFTTSIWLAALSGVCVLIALVCYTYVREDRKANT
jgi:hypothetical protein